MAQRKHIYIPNSKAASEYWLACYDRKEGSNVRIIGNPRGAAAIGAVLDQVPRVRSDLDAAETRRQRA